jgi:hypothetical protein
MNRARPLARLMCDYCAEWPLWLGDMRNPEDLALTDGLVVDVKAWQHHFDAHFHWERGWDTEAGKDWHADEGRRLARALEAEIGRDYRVELDTYDD